MCGARIDHHLAALRHESEREADVRSLTASVGTLQEHVRVLTETIATHAATLQQSEASRALLQAAFDQTTARLAEVTALCETQAADLRATRETLDGQSRTITELDAQRQAQQADSARLRQTIADLEQHRDALLSSFSWRITAPGRALLRPFTKP